MPATPEELTIVYVPLNQSWDCESSDLCRKQVVAYIATGEDDVTYGYCAEHLGTIVVQHMTVGADDPNALPLEGPECGDDCCVSEDDTPFGRGGDHCPWCGADWKSEHADDCPTAINYGTRERVPFGEAVEEKNGRWYIKMGFAGYNSVANNGCGYAYETSAIRAIQRYQAR
jgi:hypothetical protein